MSLVYITGSAGSGKSAIQNELISRGYEAHDEDDPNIGSAHNKKSNQAVKVPPIAQRTKEWFSEHEWRIYPEALKKLKLQSADKLVFLCGNVATEQQLTELFDAVIFLKIDEQTMRKRLSSRTDNDFGKAEYEVQMILTRDMAYKILHEKIKSNIINASQPIDKVVSEILALVQR